MVHIRFGLGVCVMVAGAALGRADDPAGPDLVRRATELFQQARAVPARFADAAAMFAKAKNVTQLTPQQNAAWAYCRVRAAAEQFNTAKGDPAVAAAVAKEVTEALALAPDHPELAAFGRTVLAAAGKPAPDAAVIPANAEVAADAWQLVEGDSFAVRFTGAKEPAEAVLKKAETCRAAAFAKWSGPAGGAWNPKCEIVLHPTAAAFAAATKQPAAATGHAVVKLDSGRATDRRIDVRGDDDGLLDDALPREITHVVLADLFPGKAPPRWAEEGMAVLSASATEIDRYLKTLPRCRRDGDLMTAVNLLETAGFPAAEKVTGFCVGSVSLVDFLVRWKGEKAFTTFLRDSQRYGTAAALERQYGVSGVKQLDELWAKNTK